MYCASVGLVLLFILSLSKLLAVNSNSDCDYNPAISEPVKSLLCAVESGVLKIDSESNAMVSAGCLIGMKGRCEAPMRIPTETEIPPSPAPPAAKIKQYQHLATIAEGFVEQTWWRKGFASDLLLLSHNDSELPRKQFSSQKIRNKRLKNMYQCVMRQHFIRKSYDFNNDLDPSTFDKEEAKYKCSAMENPDVKFFLELWDGNSGTSFGGEMKMGLGSDNTLVWQPVTSERIRDAALKVLDLFYTDYGGIWTGCFKFDRFPHCRGALAAASLVTSMHILADITGPDRKTFKESTFVAGYFLAAMGRGVLHGHDKNVADAEVTRWKTKCVDFIALQAAYLRLYIDSFGKLYKSQLDKFIPLAFPPTFEVHSKREWRHLSQNFEPVLSSLRNWMFTEASNLIDFGPYRPLIAEPEARAIIKMKNRRVLIDVGANGFFASPKYLLDSYSSYLPFTHAIMIEPEPHFSIYAEVGTDSSTDILKLLPTLLTKDDFVVLKFDVDPNRYAQGPTMEWGFMFKLMKTQSIAELVDELYIELHFNFPSLYWNHYHSNWEALDAIRYLRANGVIVHSWP